MTNEQLDTAMQAEVAEADNAILDTPITLAELERRHVIHTMRWANGNKAAAARVLGITIKTLYARLHECGYMANPEAFR
jgi:DNA-binding NtrC family response regulator